MISHNKQHTNDFVLLLESGSFACTCGECFANGYPCRHYMSLERAGRVAVCPLRHFHPSLICVPNAHLLDYTEYVAVPTGVLVDRLALKASITDGCRFDEAVALTKEVWMREGLGLQAGQALYPPVPDHDDTLSKREELTKMARTFVNLALGSVEIETLFREGYLKAEQLARDDATIKAKANASVGGIVGRPGTRGGRQKRKRGMNGS
jgi:hypothetical protein